MAQIYITDTLKKEVKDKLLIDQLINEIKKHATGHENLKNLYSPDKDLKVYKAYLRSGKVRAAILLKVSKNIYVPFLVVKKESFLGWNLSKYSEDYLSGKILKVLNDVESNRYKILEI